MPDEAQGQIPDQTPDVVADALVVEEAAPTVVAPRGALDETVPGGAYYVGGQLVDAEGKPVKARKR